MFKRTAGGGIAATAAKTQGEVMSCINSKITVVHGVEKKKTLTWLFEKTEVFSSASSWVFGVGP